MSLSEYEELLYEKLELSHYKCQVTLEEQDKVPGAFPCPCPNGHSDPQLVMEFANHCGCGCHEGIAVDSHFDYSCYAEQYGDGNATEHVTMRELLVKA